MKIIGTIFLTLSLFLFSCRIHKKELQIQNMNVSLLGGNTYKTNSNTGNFEINLINPDTSSTSLRTINHLNIYCPLKNPILIKLSKKDNIATLSDSKGNSIELGRIEESASNCNYDCELPIEKTDKVSVSSSLGLLPYWHGYSALGGLPLFMRYHYYTLKIKKENGNVLILQWKYSVYKYKPFGGNSKVWSGDYCEDNGGGLTKLKIKK